MRRNGVELMREYSWDKAIEPLARFCANPYVDSMKSNPAPVQTPATPALAPRLARLKNILRRSASA